jgi:hypothetical protein
MESIGTTSPLLLPIYFLFSYLIHLLVLVVRSFIFKFSTLATSISIIFCYPYIYWDLYLIWFYFSRGTRGEVFNVHKNFTRNNIIKIHCFVCPFSEYCSHKCWSVNQYSIQNIGLILYWFEIIYYTSRRQSDKLFRSCKKVMYVYTLLSKGRRK